MRRAMLGILYSDHDGLGNDRPFSDTDTLKAYTLFSKYARPRGLNVVIADPNTYEDGHLKEAWDLLARSKRQNVGIDAAWDRCISLDVRELARIERILEMVAMRVPVANHPDLVSTITDKYQLAERFGDMMPTTLLGSDIETARRQFSGRVVTKPRRGSHGYNVKIRAMRDVKALGDDYVIQQFIDSTPGIPGIIAGAHDLRVTMLNDIVVDTYVRYPQKGLISNMSLGGKMKLLEPSELPEAVEKMTRRIDAYFSRYRPRLYSIDFMLDSERPWVVELNKAPGIWGHIAVGIPIERFERLCTSIIDAFVESIEHAARVA